MAQEDSGKVRLDGSAIRRIREEQKLTQFYIAKVVGVTTDTVSRWENNRYPSVLRDNAMLLAEALEVEVDAILLDTTNSEKGASGPRFSRFAVTIIGSVILLSVFASYYFMNRTEVVNYQLSVQRLLPPHASVATQLPVRVMIDISGSVDGMVLREQFPKGFKLIEADPIPSSLDNVEGRARWILQSIKQPLLVSYLLQPDPKLEPGETLLFQGELIVNSNGKNSNAAVQGETTIPVDVYHWADANRDLVIDDGEALDASVTSIAMKNVHVDWDLVEEIWDAGSYRFEANMQKFVAVRKELN